MATFLTYEEAKKRGINTEYKNKGKRVGKGVWLNDKNEVILSGNRIKSADGYYYLLNSDGTRSFLGDSKGNYSKTVKLSAADKANMLNGNVWHGKLHGWRLDSHDINTKTKLVEGRNYFFGKDNKWHNFDTGLDVEKDKEWYEKLKDKRLQSRAKLIKSSENWWDLSNEDGIVGYGVNKALEGIGMDPNSNLGMAISGIIGTGAYFIPGVGAIAGAIDAVNNFSHGDILGGLGNLAAGIIPGGKIFKGGLKATNRALRLGARAEKYVMPKTRSIVKNDGRMVIDFNKKLLGEPLAEKAKHPLTLAVNRKLRVALTGTNWLGNAYIGADAFGLTPKKSQDQAESELTPKFQQELNQQNNMFRNGDTQLVYDKYAKELGRPLTNEEKIYINDTYLSKM